MNLRKTYHALQQLCQVNLRKTVIVNMRMLPLSQAWRLPIVIYGNCETKVVRSKLLLDVKSRCGMLSFGKQSDWMTPSSDKSLFFMIDSKLHLVGGGAM